jgi:hypothetical protein
MAASAAALVVVAPFVFVAIYTLHTIKSAGVRFLLVAPPSRVFSDLYRMPGLPFSSLLGGFVEDTVIEVYHL